MKIEDDSTLPRIMVSCKFIYMFHPNSNDIYRRVVRGVDIDIMHIDRRRMITATDDYLLCTDEARHPIMGLDGAYDLNSESYSIYTDMEYSEIDMVCIHQLIAMKDF